ncbi:toprim domain-containing protein [Luteolibacter sp. Populi]|uniref:toprim domain-containing protein n=1 Tax=Luteolibacter sp. Populi TaxID=3230487 RepID=UPI003465C3DE
MEALGLPHEAFRWAAWGQSGLGWSRGYLCYSYATGLKWRNPDPQAKPRFQWLTGKASSPWRSEWIKPHTSTVYLTEGESDCLALIAAGLENAENVACVAIPSAPGFAPEWAPLFKGKRVVLCFDDGPAGRDATANAAGALKSHASEVFKWKGAAIHG